MSASLGENYVKHANDRDGKNPRMPVIVQSDRHYVAELLVLQLFDGERTLAANVEIVSQELNGVQTEECEDVREQRTLSHLNTMSTSLSDNGLRSL
jgi:hypothetical protein